MDLGAPFKAVLNIKDHNSKLEDSYTAYSESTAVGKGGMGRRCGGEGRGEGGMGRRCGGEGRGEGGMGRRRKEE